MFQLDVSHTCHTRARTGIQRVVRSLNAALNQKRIASPITWDPYARHWRELSVKEKATLSNPSPAPKRSAKWPWRARLHGYWDRWNNSPPTLPMARGLIVPEIFSPEVAQAFEQLHTAGPKVAIFHDAIALKLPQLTPDKTVARYPSYLQELLAFDGIAAVSDDSRQALVNYWRWLGMREHPPVVGISLGIDPAPPLPSRELSMTDPVVLSVGSLEGRKNHLALLSACERLWTQQARFSLRLIGLAHPQTGRAALDKIQALQAAGHPLRYDGPVNEATLEAAYAECCFTVYPSLMEGFGLPILESLARGKPCICSGHGALGESARPGGCLLLEQSTTDELANSIAHLLQHPSDRSALAKAARSRTFRSWSDYTNDLLAWMQTLR